MDPSAVDKYDDRDEQYPHRNANHRLAQDFHGAEL